MTVRRTALLPAAAAVAALTLAAGCGGGSAKATQGGKTAASAEPSGSSASAAGVELKTTPPPWQPPLDEAHIKAAGLEALGHENLKVHYHAHLGIWDQGKNVPVPPGIGFLVKNGNAVGISALHTHDDTGVIHVESDKDVPFTLGQVFTEWGVRLTQDCVGGLCADSSHALKFFVNGTPYTGDPAKIVLKSHQEIAVQYGDPAKLPKPPAKYDFPAGE